MSVCIGRTRVPGQSRTVACTRTATVGRYCEVHAPDMCEVHPDHPAADCPACNRPAPVHTYDADLCEHAVTIDGVTIATAHALTAPHWTVTYAGSLVGIAPSEAIAVRTLTRIATWTAAAATWTAAHPDRTLRTHP